MLKNMSTCRLLFVLSPAAPRIMSPSALSAARIWIYFSTLQLLFFSLLNSFLVIAQPECAPATGCSGSHLSRPAAPAQSARCCQHVPAPANAAPQSGFPDWNLTLALPKPHPSPAHRPSHKGLGHPEPSAARPYWRHNAAHRARLREHAGCSVAA